MRRRSVSSRHAAYFGVRRSVRTSAHQDRRAFASRGQAAFRERRHKRTIRVRRQVVAVVAVAGSIVLGATAAFAFYSARGRGASTTTVIGPNVTMSAGSVSGLYPGAQKALQVTVDNEGSVPFAVTAARVTKIDQAAGCPATAIGVSAPSPAPTIAPSTKASVKMLVSMPTDAPAACQGSAATVRLMISGRSG